MSSYQLIELSGKERSQLEALLKQTEHVRNSRFIVALLKIADGDSPELVADALDVNLVTVYRWIDHYNSRRQAVDLLERLRGGRPSTLRALDEQKLEQLLEQSPEHHGYRATAWSVMLLRSHVRSILVSRSAMRRYVDVSMNRTIAKSAHAMSTMRLTCTRSRKKGHRLSADAASSQCNRACDR
jgi:transposase